MNTADNGNCNPHLMAFKVAVLVLYEAVILTKHQKTWNRWNNSDTFYFYQQWGENGSMGKSR